MFQKQSTCGLYRRHLKEGANGVIVKKGCVVIPAINNRFSIQGKRPSKQQGATLIEVMVAIFVLAFGVLALMVAQLRSVSSVQEAENQTVVAQAAQTLMEGMLVNPVVSVVGGSANKDYAAYAKAMCWLYALSMLMVIILIIVLLIRLHWHSANCVDLVLIYKPNYPT